MRIRHWKGYTLLFGLTLLIPALIFSGGLRSVLPFFAAPKGEKGEAGADSAEGGVVCYGYADLESGVVSLYPDLTGRVVDVPVHENDVVAAGAVLVRLDDHLARLRVDEARAALESAQAQLAQAQKDSGEQGGKIARQEAAVAAARHRAANARHSLLAKKRLQAIDAIGRSRPDPVTAEEVAAAEENVAELEDAAQGEEDLLAEVRGQDPSIALRHARADVATMEARLGEANETLEEQTLRAAARARCFVSWSHRATCSAPVKTAAIQFCPQGPRVIRAEVDQAFAARVAAGQTAAIEDDVRPGVAWTGRVVRVSDWYTQRRLVSDEALQTKDVRTLECIVAVDSDQPPLRIGQRVRVRLVPGRRDEPSLGLASR